MPYYYCEKCKMDWESTDDLKKCPTCRVTDLVVLEQKTPMEMAVDELKEIKFAINDMVNLLRR